LLKNQYSLSIKSLLAVCKTKKDNLLTRLLVLFGFTASKIFITTTIFKYRSKLEIMIQTHQITGYKLFNKYLSIYYK